MIISMKLISIAFDMDSDISQESQNQPKIEPKIPEKEENLTKKDLRKRKFLQSKQEIPNEPKIENNEIMILRVPSFFEYFGYALCPGTTVFGPWVSYKEYLGIFINPRWVSY